jgi:hypothetical protein
MDSIVSPQNPCIYACLTSNVTALELGPLRRQLRLNEDIGQGPGPTGLIASKEEEEILRVHMEKAMQGLREKASQGDRLH